MPEQVAGFPYWEVTFDERGALSRPADADALLGELPAAGVTDVLVMAHGWNSTRETARDLYARFFGQVRAVLERPGVRQAPRTTVGTVGVVWPSMRWPDEPVPAPPGGGAARLRRAPADATQARALKAVFTAPEQRRALDELARLLATRPQDPRALARFQQLLRPLVAGPDAAPAAEDNGERALLTAHPQRVFAHFAAVAPRPRRQGAAGFVNPFARLWDGAKEALRAATYWEMKKRAGVVGQDGLAPLLGRLVAARPRLRLHLLGHSFGARLVAFTAKALLAPAAGGGASPVKSVVLLQGAFSHFAFAPALPHDRARSGALAGAERRVDGPVAVTHSARDSALGELYPLASLVGRDDAAAADDLLFRWGAIGYDGAQAVPAATAPLGPVGRAYPFTTGAILNLDGNAVIATGGPPAGAHGDIFDPEVAWAALAAAGLAAPA